MTSSKRTGWGLSLLVALALASGCATAGSNLPVQPVEKERVIARPFDAVWQDAIEWFSTHNTPIKNLDKASGLISTEYSLSVVDRARYADCGTSSDMYRVVDPTGNFNVMITRQGETSTKVVVNVFYSCTVDNYQYACLLCTNLILASSQKRDCTSTGALEREILEFLSRDSLPVPAGPPQVAAPQPQPQPQAQPQPQTAAAAQCVSDSECRAGRVCRAGACEYPSCARDIDCPENTVCERGACVAPRTAAPPVP